MRAQRPRAGHLCPWVCVAITARSPLGERSDMLAESVAARVGRSSGYGLGLMTQASVSGLAPVR